MLPELKSRILKSQQREKSVIEPKRNKNQRHNNSHPGLSVHQEKREEKREEKRGEEKGDKEGLYL